MKLTRRLLTKIIAVGLAATPSVSMFSGTEAWADTITLKISHAWPNRTEFLDKMRVAFNAAHEDVQIEYVAAGDNWQPLFQSTLRDSLVGQLPDVTHQLINYTHLYLEKGIAQPVDTIPGGQEFIASSGMSQALVEAAAANDHVYAVPYGLTVPVVFYNMSLLKKAGWDRPPQTWDEIIAAAAKVSALGGNISGGYFEFEASNNWMYQNVLSGLGGSMKGDNGTIGFDSELGVEAMSIIGNFAKAANTVAMTRDQARQAFNAGTVGILIRPASGIPSILKAAQANNFELEVGAFPVTTGKGKLSAVSHGMFVLTDDPARQKAALQYIEWAYGPEAQALEAEYAGYLPANSKALNESNQFADYLKANPYVRSLTASLSNAGDWYTYPVDNTDQIFDAQIEVVRGVVTGKTEPAAAVAQMSAETEKLLK
ncbi:extracellular solute-binding protein [Mesorhizobium sp. M5C.F.Ca.IN.020.32.2.1]|uniref:extracellular solute-binding protein n=1 Tax=Mesorhizobium sp. M5C.F.Ca.IN.020.32.2.1 TaxID=2496771 RepID=UPI0013E2DB92|nr:extracellular solute-binding protein [Mesorhizobium sp. M5C.F.Ca.IN.020.32.2.1]